MIYRRLDHTGLKISALSFGSWVTFRNQADVDHAAEMMTAAYDAGVNFFDNAQAYAKGESEEIMGDCLKRMDLDHVNLVYCHRDDEETPVEEVAWAMHNIIERGQALYWGTSEWTPERILPALEVCEKHHLHKPVVEQPVYNLFERHRFASEYDAIYQDNANGATTWCP